MKGKDLTKINSLEEISVGNCAWFSRTGNYNGHRKGVVSEKGIKSILVTEYYWSGIDNPTIKKNLYFMDNNELIKLTELNNTKNYHKIAKQLKEQGIKLRK